MHDPFKASDVGEVDREHSLRRKYDRRANRYPLSRPVRTSFAPISGVDRLMD
jgi:hypothetical protein